MNEWKKGKEAKKWAQLGFIVASLKPLGLREERKKARILSCFLFFFFFFRRYVRTGSTGLHFLSSFSVPPLLPLPPTLSYLYSFASSFSSACFLCILFFRPCARTGSTGLHFLSSISFPPLAATDHRFEFAKLIQKFVQKIDINQKNNNGCK